MGFRRATVRKFHSTKQGKVRKEKNELFHLNNMKIVAHLENLNTWGILVFSQKMLKLPLGYKISHLPGELLCPWLWSFIYLENTHHIWSHFQLETFLRWLGEFFIKLLQIVFEWRSSWAVTVKALRAIIHNFFDVYLCWSGKNMGVASREGA